MHTSQTTMCKISRSIFCVLHKRRCASKISRSMCTLHKRRCARFADPYAYFTNYFTSFYTKENFTWLSRNPKKKVSASSCCCTFSCAGNLHTLSEMLLGFQTFASCTSLYDRLARTSSSIELLPICSRRHFGALKYIIRVWFASCALIGSHSFFVTAACYKLRYKQFFYINLSLENKSYRLLLNFTHIYTFYIDRSIEIEREIVGLH
jgi:hypothetical protein